VEEARAWRSFNAEAGAGVLEKPLFTDTDRDGGFKPGFEQIKKENFYVGVEHDVTKDSHWTGIAEQDRKILRVDCHICK
jgi:hypothetical protein